MKRGTFWRQPVSAEPPAAPAPPSPKRFDPVWIEAPLTMLSWFLPGGAVVVGALGQFMLALVLLAIACGVWLRLWRGRKMHRAARRTTL
ncbi:MAG: hypothetical protein KKB95_08135 [Gammaproteobacteria bacterium]|nr:hypothetical protein [Gammaproteobacteria bacterium]MBU1507465.1 hypothetical protein [Gammaproteobacteria bacterium]MBU2119190.1 hypothetical protein [Gammaproteobacteria bacterium]MBU2173349.1 hypothetical protein [Gammaproteobacteria bacterium]MBU2202398.1 hypothetical protein [Gammaproteobacteria bacterium]